MDIGTQLTAMRRASVAVRRFVASMKARQQIIEEIILEESSNLALQQIRRQEIARGVVRLQTRPQVDLQ